MATLRTVTVKTSGGNYTTLSAAVAAECASTNLVSLDRQLDIVCDAILDTTRVTIPSTCTTDATRYVRVVGPAHLGVVANAYRLHPTADYNKALTIQTAYVHLVDISVQHESTSGNTSNGDSAVYYDPPSATALLTLDKLLSLKSAHQGVIVTQGVVKAKNCAVVASTTAMEIGDNTGSSLSTYVYNCVLKGGTGAGLEKNGNGTTQATNCYAASASTSAYLQTLGTLTRTTCASDDTTGSTGLQSIAYSTTNFTNVTAGSEDFHLVSGSSLIDAGTDLSADSAFAFSTDMYGDTRTTPWDVGVDQISGVPTGNLAKTNANDTLAATGTTTVTGSLARTNVNDSSSATGTTTVVGSLTVTNANDTGAISGSVGEPVSGTLTVTNVNDTSAATGTTTILGTVAKTNTNDTSAAQGTTTVVGTISVTNVNDTLSANGSIGSAVGGSLAVTNANDTLVASGTTTITASLAITNLNDTSSASGTTTILGTLSITNSNDTLAASGTSGTPAAGIGTKLPLTGVGG